MNKSEKENKDKSLSKSVDKSKSKEVICLTYN